MKFRAGIGTTLFKATTLYGPELHTSANAASDPNGNEADATTGFISAGLSGTGANVFESQSSIKNTGSYSIHSDCNDTPTSGAYFRRTFTVENVESYRITFDWRHIGTGLTWGWRVDSVYQSESAAITDLTFGGVTKVVVASGTTLVVQWNENNSSNNGGIYLDNLSVRKIL